MKQIVNRVSSKLSNIMVAFDAGARVELECGYSPGIAHMLEHCMFKGTSNRSWEELNKDIGFIGGEVNAFTSHDIVAYYITVPYENTEDAVEIVSDMILNSQIEEAEFIKEREVVKEEEASKLDGIDSFLWDTYSKEFFSNYISNPVIGTKDSISSFTRDEVFSFYKKYCNRKKAVVSLSGCKSKRELKKLLVKYFGKASSSNIRNFDSCNVSYSNSKLIEATRGGIEHSYVWIGYPGVSSDSELSSAAKIMNIILGSGMDSRLFSEIRERRGLAYSIGSSMSQWEYGSLNLISASTRDDNVDDLVMLVNKEISLLKDNGITEEELQRAKNKVRAGLYHANESSYSASFRSIKTEIFKEETFDELSESLNGVSVDDVCNAANDIFNSERCITMICRGE